MKGEAMPYAALLLVAPRPPPRTPLAKGGKGAGRCWRHRSPRRPLEGGEREFAALLTGGADTTPRPPHPACGHPLPGGARGGKGVRGIVIGVPRLPPDPSPGLRPPSPRRGEGGKGSCAASWANDGEEAW